MVRVHVLVCMYVGLLKIMGKNVFLHNASYWETRQTGDTDPFLVEFTMYKELPYDSELSTPAIFSFFASFNLSDSFPFQYILTRYSFAQKCLPSQLSACLPDFNSNINFSEEAFPDLP